MATLSQFSKRESFVQVAAPFVLVTMWLHKKTWRERRSLLSIWKMQPRSLGFRAKKREIHQAINKQSENILCGCLGHNLSGFFILSCAFWFFILSPESSPWALWSLGPPLHHLVFTPSLRRYSIDDYMYLLVSSCHD
jgi:hypothetical protein